MFQIITLPVEFDASRRAKEQLFRLGIVSANERTAISKVLSAAAHDLCRGEWYGSVAVVILDYRLARDRR